MGPDRGDDKLSSEVSFSPPPHFLSLPYGKIFWEYTCLIHAQTRRFGTHRDAS